MSKHILVLTGVVVLSVVLAACAATEVETPAPTDAPVPVESSVGSLEKLARQDLAGRLALAEDAIVVEATTEKELPSADLGCPEAAVATPDKTLPAVVMGQVLTLLAGDKAYTYHGYGARIAYCGETPSAETVSGQPIGVDLEAIMESLDEQGRTTVTLAREALAGQLNIPVDEVNVVQAGKERWSDSSLGCPEDGKMYAQAITPGYRVILEVGGQQYDYHANDGGLLKLCEGTQ